MITNTKKTPAPTLKSHCAAAAQACRPAARPRPARRRRRAGVALVEPPPCHRAAEVLPSPCRAAAAVPRVARAPPPVGGSECPEQPLKCLLLDGFVDDNTHTVVIRK